MKRKPNKDKTMIELMEGWSWGSHTPVIKYVLAKYDIGKIVEQGTGVHSTPLFLESGIKYQGYEEDALFRLQMIEEGVYSGEQVSLLTLPNGVNIMQMFSELSDTQVEQIIFEYDKVYYEMQQEFKQIGGLKLLFVDGYTATRNLCINMLNTLFDIVIVHDTEPNSWEHYQYNFRNEYFKEHFNIISVTTPVPYTTMLIRKGLDIDYDLIRKYMNEYCDMNGWTYDQMDIILG